MVFFNPMVTRIGNREIPTIVYPSEGVDAVFDRKDRGCIERYLNGVWIQHGDLFPGDTEYIVGVVWNDFNDTMADLRLNRRTQSYANGHFGYLGNVLTFRNWSNYRADPSNKEEGDTCGNEDIVVGREEEHRRTISPNDVNVYVFGSRPVLPEWLRVGEDFFLIE